MTTLNINNIKLLINNSYQLDDNYGVLMGQLLDNQIKHLCKTHLNIPHLNVFKTDYPRNYLIEQIINTQGYNITIDTCETCQKLGLVPKKTKNNYTYNNLGGKTIRNFHLNPSMTYLDDTEENEYLYVDEELTIHLPIVDGLISQQIEDKPEQHKPEKSKLADILQKYNKTRINIVKDAVKSKKTVLLKYGRISAVKNSSYIDSILAPIFFQSSGVLNKLIFADNSRNANLFSKDKSEVSRLVNEYNNSKSILAKLNEKFVDKDTINFESLIKLWKIGSDYMDVLHFLPELLTKMLLKSYPYTSKIRHYIDKKLDYYSELPEKTIKTTIEDTNEKVDIINANYDVSVIQTMMYNLLDNVPGENYCYKCNLKVEENIEQHLKAHDEIKLIPQLQYLLSPKTKQDYVLKDGWIETKRGFKKGDKGVNYRFEIAKSLGAFNEVKNYLEEVEIKDTRCINFMIGRNTQRFNKQTNNFENYFLDVEVIPLKTISDTSGNVYGLDFIVIQESNNALVYFVLDGVWYLYNSHFDPEVSNDFVIKIGSYKKLLEHQSHIVLTRSAILSYSLTDD